METEHAVRLKIRGTWLYRGYSLRYNIGGRPIYEIRVYRNAKSRKVLHRGRWLEDAVEFVNAKIKGENK